MSMSTDGTSTSASATLAMLAAMLMAKFVTSMAAALLAVSEPLTANALAPDHETRLLTRAIAARRRHSGSMRPAPITAAVKWSLPLSYAVEGPTL